VQEPQHRWPTEEEDENAQGDESIYGNEVTAMRKVIPWTDGTEPDENGDVENHVDARLK